MHAYLQLLEANSVTACHERNCSFVTQEETCCTQEMQLLCIEHLSLCRPLIMLQHHFCRTCCHPRTVEAVAVLSAGMMGGTCCYHNQEKHIVIDTVSLNHAWNLGRNVTFWCLPVVIIGWRRRVGFLSRGVPEIGTVKPYIHDHTATSAH